MVTNSSLASRIGTIVLIIGIPSAIGYAANKTNRSKGLAVGMGVGVVLFIAFYAIFGL